MTVWLLVIVLWQVGTSPPDIITKATGDRAACVRLADSFADAELQLNGENPPAFADHFAVSCELKTGGNAESL